MAQESAERRVGFYIRVSTERQARVQEGSLKNQRQMLEAELERRNQQSPGWGAFVDAYVDEGLSGKNTNRPAFQRMMQDLEIGRIDTVMFTELSRLSRSLKDFLNIFESAQKHQCDLVCLKTDIDTTSPYKSLITKILMIFAEFEREMTSRRTSANAYERSKRGLANGGVAPLGYRRDKKRKGYLIVDPVESRVVQAIFAAYLREHSIKRTAEKVWKDHRSLRLTRSKVHSILTSKAYIGVRAIYKRDAANAQEVPAVWEPIIAKATFDKVQAALRTNRERYHRYPDRTRYAYLFSGILRCGACGQLLHGRSAWSSTRKRHHYYVHHTACPGGGLTRINADLVHKLVLDWLRDIAANGERFERLRQEGVKRIRRRIAELPRECARTDAEQAALSAEIESRIRELTRTKADPVRRSTETSITKLEADKDQNAQARLYVADEIDTLEKLTTARELFRDYQATIREALAAMGTGRDPRTALAGILASLTLFPDQLKAALSAVNLKEPRSRVSVFPPASRQKANPRTPSLIEDRLPLPGRFLLSDPARLASMHEQAGLSVVQIARRLGVSHAGVVAALRRLGIAADGGRNGHAVKGQVPFGWDFEDCRLVKNGAEQQVIRLMRQLQGGGESLNGIARELNRRLVPTKNAGIWQANTVGKILHRVAARAAS